MNQKQSFMEFALSIGLCVSKEFLDLTEVDFQKKLHQFAEHNDFVRKNSPMKVIRTLKLEAAEIIDVGVRHGTPWLYNSFPDADFVLIDPQQSGESALRVKPRKYTFLNYGIGSTPGKSILKEQNAKSTLLNRTPLTETATTDKHEIKLITLDDVISGYCKSESIGIKLDTEGYELECINGLKENWRKVNFLIAEASIKQRFEGGYDFSQLLSELRRKDFLFANILNSSHPYTPNFYDVLFLPKAHSAFR